MDQDNIVGLLQDSSLYPLAAWTVQHQLCEYRKLVCPAGRPYGSQSTPDDQYMALWEAVAPLYHLHRSRRSGIA
eukprot:3050633-Karenia_brevis.AAC.1